MKTWMDVLDSSYVFKVGYNKGDFSKYTFRLRGYSLSIYIDGGYYNWYND